MLGGKRSRTTWCLTMGLRRHTYNHLKSSLQCSLFPPRRDIPKSRARFILFLVLTLAVDDTNLQRNKWLTLEGELKAMESQIIVWLPDMKRIKVSLPDDQISSDQIPIQRQQMIMHVTCALFGFVACLQDNIRKLKSNVNKIYNTVLNQFRTHDKVKMRFGKK